MIRNKSCIIILWLLKNIVTLQTSLCPKFFTNEHVKNKIVVNFKNSIKCFFAAF